MYMHWNTFLYMCICLKNTTSIKATSLFEIQYFDKLLNDKKLPDLWKKTWHWIHYQFSLAFSSSVSSLSANEIKPTVKIPHWKKLTLFYLKNKTYKLYKYLSMAWMVAKGYHWCGKKYPKKTYVSNWVTTIPIHLQLSFTIVHTTS